ncbi:MULTISPECIES: ABC transporter permease [Cohnella]|uniref:ABC transporter permease n=1 Tax=Cohnella TaxID=329857 RepID=UPI0009B9900C|nr:MULTISPECIES: ABC transporter permease [Cohnella]MBN2983227.1 ABC transporter permease [Cohnella algarum]
MMAFLRLLSTERLKQAKSRIGWLIPISPLLSLAVGLLSQPPEEASQSESFAVVLSSMSFFHAMLLLPILVGLFASNVCRYEHMGGGWKQLLSLPVTRTKLYAAKYMMIAWQIAIVQALLAAAAVAVFYVRKMPGELPWDMLLSSALGGWVACLPLAALQLGVSLAWSSFAAPLAVNIALTLPNILIVNSAQYGPFYPWAQPMIAMIPRESNDTFGALGLPLESIMITVAGSFAAFVAAGLIYFKRKAV